MKEPIVLLPKIICGGHRVVFPIKTVIEREEKPERPEDSDEEDHIDGQAEDDQPVFTHECTIFVFSVAVPRSLDGPISELTVLHEFDFAVACISEHMLSRGLIIGFAEVTIGQGCVVIWPQYQPCSGKFATVTGTMGAWSPEADMVVTWTVPAEVLPEESAGGSCFLFTVDELDLMESGHRPNAKPVLHEPTPHPEGSTASTSGKIDASS